MSQSYLGTTMRLVVKATLAIVACTVAAPAPAAQMPAPHERRAQERAARKACLDGEYAKGVSILSDLFLDTRDANYIFNQGRCFEQNRRFENAIAKFEEYLRAGAETLGRADREAAEKHIADCRNKLPTTPRDDATATAPAAFVPPTPVATSEPAQGESSPVVMTQPEPPPVAARTGRGLRIAGIVTASAGAAALVTGVLLNLKVNSIVSEMENEVAGYTADKNRERNTFQTATWVAYGVGAACVVTGAILYGVGFKSGRSPAHKNKLALLPVVERGQAGALLAGAF